MTPAPDPALPGSTLPFLIGRAREEAMLRGHLTAALGGHGSLVLIGGEAGIGKTALAEEICREATVQGALVLVGRCYDLTETPPYGAWIDLFARHVPLPTCPPFPSPFAERWTVGPVPSQMALFVQVDDFLRAVANQQPLVMLFEDLHWADPGSLDLLRFVSRSLVALPLLILLTYRSDELARTHPLYQLLPSLRRDAAVHDLALGRLTDDAVRALIKQRYPVPESDIQRLAAHLRRRAEGNALFVGELLRSLEEMGTLRQDGARWTLGALDAAEVPAPLRQVIDARLARLGEEAQRAIAVAAAIGQEVSLPEWAALMGTERGEEVLLAIVERATEAHLLVETPDGLHVRFAHALIREAVYQGISPARRRLLHRRIAELLAAQPQPDPDAVAMHFQRAADGRAGAWLVKAGERAQLAYAWLTAIARYESALALLESSDGDLGERGWLRYRIARLRRHSTPEQGVEYLDEVLRIAAVVGDRALAAAARFSRGLCLLWLFHATGSDVAIREMAAGADALEALPAEEQERLDLGPDAQGVPTITTPRGMLVQALAGRGRIAEAMAMGEGTREGKSPSPSPLPQR